MTEKEIYRIRPTARHILTIGRELIQDSWAAVVELVKNAYDADSPDVLIEFRGNPDNQGYKIIITDHGHGMSRDDVIHKWLVPSTPDKFHRKRSPEGRIMQGRKGIGRYAAAILGSDLLLETVTAKGEKTTAFIEWKRFEDADFLDQVEIPVTTTSSDEPQGTRLTITGGRELSDNWTIRADGDGKNENASFATLKKELRKLLSPVDSAEKTFSITLQFENFPGTENLSGTMEPLPLLDIFDYRISGTISAEGQGLLTYIQQNARNTVSEEIPFKINGTGCGKLEIDIRVYDREAKAIEAFARRLGDRSGNYLGKLEARKLLDTFNGIGVYRNGFRIRPLGDPEFDWLGLNKQRVQNPSQRIGSDQIIGYVCIQSEDSSHLFEKSARDGLRENAAFDALKKITKAVIGELETRRFAYRKKAGLSRRGLKLEQQLERLFSLEDLKKNIRTHLLQAGTDPATVDEVDSLICRSEEAQNKAADDIRQAVALYQGQATLGKIITVVVHEGRRALNYFSNEIPRFKRFLARFESGDTTVLSKLTSIMDGVAGNAEIFRQLFNKINPLAITRRAPRKPLLLKKNIERAIAVFDTVIQEQDVSVHINCPDDFKFSSWEQDIYTIFTNLVDNSLYWMEEKRTTEREISIDVAIDGGMLLYIDYRDTGPGIEPRFIEDDIIFEPHFSTKPDGTGIGLPIAGEAATRNNMNLEAIDSDSGAYFRLQPVEERNV